MAKCSECDGTGKVECPMDWNDGTCKENKCSYCSGQGWVPCDECGGTGEIEEDDDK